MFGRDKTAESPTEASPASDREHRPGAKNRPTPKRREQEAARRQPLVQTDRKAAKAANRERRRESQVKVRQAMVTGDDTHLPARDKGPVRRHIRDYVDARWSLGEFLLPLMVLVLLVSLFAAQWATIMFVVVYAVLLLAIIDAVLMWRRLKGRITEKFGADTPMSGLAMYAVMRTFQLRRSRMPRPLVDRGEYPA